MEITLSIRKEDVMREVAVTTAYTGGKMDQDENALDRISTVDEDENHLERFWDESRADLSQELLELVTFEGMVRDEASQPVEPVYPGGTSASASAQSESESKPQASTTVQGTGGVGTRHYEVRLNVSNAFEEALLPSMNKSLYSFFVHNICAKWYVYTNKEEAGDYADKAATLLDDVHRKAVYKKRPVRPTYDD